MGKKKKTAEIVCILDKSGSMQPLTDDTIGGFNSFIEKQKELPIEATVTLVLFDSRHRSVYERVNLADVKPLDNKAYYASGTTALLDAVGSTIESTHREQKKGGKPDKTVFCIITDGHENASLDYTRDRVKELIEKRQEKGWVFFFLGANIDSFSEASSLGINIHTVADYQATTRGTAKAYAAATLGVSSALMDDNVSTTWSNGLLEDEENYE